MRQKSKQVPRADRTYDSLKDILEEEEFYKSIEERERNLQSRKTEQYFDQLLLSRLQDGDPFLGKLTRMSTQGLEDEYFDLIKRLPEPEIETTTKPFDSGILKGTRTVRKIKQTREYYMINMIRAELRRRRRAAGNTIATGMKDTPSLQGAVESPGRSVDNPGSEGSHDDPNGVLSERTSNQLQSDYNNLRNENRALTEAVVRLKRRRKADHFTEDQLRELVEANRKKNGKINYLKISKIMGVHHTTAKRRLNSHGIR